MDHLQRKLKTRNFVNFNPAKVAALNTLDRNIASRGGGDAAQARIAEEQKKNAQAALDEEGKAEDEIDLFSYRYNSQPSSSRNGGGGGGSSWEGGGGGGAGKGKERETESAYVPSAQTEADKKKQARLKQREEVEKGIRNREARQRREEIQAKEREDAGHRGGGGGRSRELDSDDDDDDLPEVGAIGGSYGRARTKATSSSKSAGKCPRRSSSPLPSKLNVAASPSPSPSPPPPPPPPKQAPLPNFKKKTNTTSSTTKLTKDDDVSRSYQPKASTSTTSSSSKRPLHDLDSPERDRKTLDLDKSPSPSRSPSSRFSTSAKPNGSTSRRDVPPRSDSCDMELVEDALSPQKPLAARPKPKARTIQGVAGLANAVVNPFGVKSKPSGPSYSSKHLQPSNSDAPPFAGSKPSSLSSSSKPSKIKKTSSAQLPNSSEEELEEERDTVLIVGGVALVSKARKKVKLTEKDQAKRKAAEEVRAAMQSGEEFDDLVETEDDEEEGILVDLRKKEVVEASSSKGPGEGKSELKAKAKTSRILELAAVELEAGLKDKAAKERKVELYGEEDEVYETDHPHPHPELLCIFCSELLPPVPSPKLLALMLRLKKLSYPAPTIFNPRAVSLSMIKSINACTLHRSESKQFPVAKKNGWPMEIDWAEVQRRVEDPKMVKHLGQVIESKDSNPFLLFAKERAEDVGVALARTAKGQYEVFEKAQPGYFGEIGQILFHQILSTIFIPSRINSSLSTYGSSLPLLTSAASSPLTPSDFVYFVLIPELALKLIQQDLGLTEYIEAYNVMLNSRAYGNSRFAAEEGEAAGGVLMQGWDENGEEMHDGADDGILVSRRRRVGSGDEESLKGKGKEVKRDAPKGLRPPSPPSSDDEGPPRKKPTAVFSTTFFTKPKLHPSTLDKRPRSASPNPPPPPSKRRSLSRSPPPKWVKKTSSPSSSTPKPPPMHPFFNVAKKEPTVVAPPPPSTSSSTSKPKPARPKPKPALAPSSTTTTTANAIAGSSKPKLKPEPRLKSPVKIDLDSDEDEDSEERRKEERDKTVTPPKQPKRKKQYEYVELDEEWEGESQETSVPESPKGKKGRSREEEEPEEGNKSLKRTHSMKRTESENRLWESLPSDEVDFDVIFE